MQVCQFLHAAGIDELDVYNSFNLEEDDHKDKLPPILEYIEE